MAGAADDRLSGPDGGRGEAWTVAQFALFGVLLVAPDAGPHWPRALSLTGRLIGVSLLASGGYLVLRGMTDLGPSFTPLPRPKDDAALVRAGVYGWVRHPIYLGAVLTGFGWAALTASTTRQLLAGGLLALLNAKADREEAWLLARFPEYAAYRAEVKKWPLG